MRKIPVYLCNKKKCENGACELCHYTTDINYAERNTNDEPIVAYDLDEDVVFVEEFKGGDKVTYWEALDIIERGSLNYADIHEAYSLAHRLIKEKVRELDEAEVVEFRESQAEGSLYGTTTGPLIIDEFCGRPKNETNANGLSGTAD